MRQTLIICLFLGSLLVTGQSLTTSLTACYSLDGNANDPISSLNGTLSSVTPTVDRFNSPNSAYFFSGNASSYIELPNDPLLKPANAISFSVWLKPNSNTGRHIIYTKNNQSFDFEAYQLCILLGNPVFRLNKANGIQNNIAISTTTVTPGVWYHVAGSIDNNAVKLYINGVLEGSVTSTFSGFDYQIGKKVYLGDSHETFSHPYLGSMDNLRFYNRTLTAAEVSLLYNTDPVCTNNPATPAITASFTAPDTVCIAQPVSLVNTSSGTITGYNWSICGSTLSSAPQATNLGNPGNTLSGPVYLSINNDGGNNYVFLTNNISGTISRLSYGSSLNNTPVANTVATGLSNVEDIYIHKEQNNWYGIVVGGISGYVARLNFGSSLANPPTVTNMGNIGSLSYPHTIKVFETNGNYYALVINQSNNSVTRLNFGTSISNTPVGVSLGVNANLNSPSQMAVIHSAGAWHAFICNAGNNTLARLDFGNSLLNTPTYTNLGNPSSQLNNPRGLVLYNKCSSLSGFIANQGTNSLMEMDFPSGPTGAISLNSLGNLGSLSYPQTIVRHRTGDSINLFIPNVTNNSISRIIYPLCNSLPSSTLQTPSPYTFTSSGLYTISLTANEGQLNQSAFCKTIYVSPNNFVSAASSSSSVCSGNSLTLSATGAISTYTWFPSGITGSSIVVSPTASLVYTVTGLNSAGCLGSATLAVAVLSSPDLSVSATPSLICSGAASTLDVAGATSYTWQPGNIVGSSFTVSPSTSVIYTVTGTNSLGCISTGTQALSLVTTPSIQISASSTLVCNGATATLTASGANTYTWLPSQQTGSVTVVSPTSVTLYTVIGANGNCSSQAQITLSVGLATGISSSGNLCNHSSIDLTASPNGTDYSYAWSGPGITGSTLTSTVNVNAGGVYTVLITNTLTGCIGSSTFQVTSSANPIQLAVNPSSTVSCFPGPPVNILVTAPANLSWLPATEVTPNTGPLVSVNPSVTTSYTVNAISGTCTGSAVITISVNTTPTVTNTGGDFTICAGNSATLSASGASNYVWQPGQITGSSVVVSPFGTTVYTVTGFNGNCVSSVGASVTVLPKPDLITSVFPSTICIGHTATVSASGAVIYSWVDAGILINTPTIIVTPTVSTTYTVIGDNDFGCTSAATVFLNVINSPAISAIASATNICAGETLTLNAAGSENYTWTPGFQTGASISASPSVSTTYTVNGGNSFCSYATVFVLVNVCENTNFGVTLLADEPQELNGGLYKIRFTATAINNSASDFTEVELVNDLARTFLSPLSYTVISAPVVASQNSQLKANSLFDGRIQLSLTSPSSSTLVANKRDTLQFSVLLNPNGFEGVVKNFVIGFAKDKNNQVLSDTSNNGFLWDPDNDGDPTNNNQTTDIRLNKIDLFIPGGFSPDGDGLNDRFIISGLNGRTVKLIVFNRWGNKVYEQDNYDNSWDGTANVRGASVGSGRLPEATYYYILEFAGSKQDVKTGFVVLRH